MRPSFVLALASVLAWRAPERPAARAQESAVDAVSRLYAAYAWETGSGDSSRADRVTLFAADPGVMRQYLDSGLVNAVLRDRACQEREQGECNLGFEPIWDSQDPAGARVEVIPTSKQGVVQARLHYPYEDATRVVTYRMRATPGGWRVQDMGGAEWPSLLALLGRPLR